MDKLILPTTHQEVESLYQTNDGVLHVADDHDSLRLSDYDRHRFMDEHYTLLHVASGGHPYRGKLVVLGNTPEAALAIDRGSQMYFRDRYGFDKEAARKFSKWVTSIKFGREKPVQELAMMMIERPPRHPIRLHRVRKDLVRMGYDPSCCSEKRAEAAVQLAGRMIGKRLLRHYL